jgi:hypothetical protein
LTCSQKFAIERTLHNRLYTCIHVHYVRRLHVPTYLAFFKEVARGVGSKPGSSWFHFFLIFTTLQLSQSGSPPTYLKGASQLYYSWQIASPPPPPIRLHELTWTKVDHARTMSENPRAKFALLQTIVVSFQLQRICRKEFNLRTPLPATRVTRLGAFSTLGRLISFDSFC